MPEKFFLFLSIIVCLIVVHPEISQANSNFEGKKQEIDRLYDKIANEIDKKHTEAFAETQKAFKDFIACEINNLFLLSDSYVVQGKSVNIYDHIINSYMDMRIDELDSVLKKDVKWASSAKSANADNVVYMTNYLNYRTAYDWPEVYRPEFRKSKSQWTIFFDKEMEFYDKFHEGNTEKIELCRLALQVKRLETLTLEYKGVGKFRREKEE